MLSIIPKLYVHAGKCVSIQNGSIINREVSPLSPVDLARQIEESGIQRIELIDIEGSRSNSPTILGTLSAIKSSTSLNVTFGGGIKSRESLKNALSEGADLIMCNSIAVMQPNVFTYWLDCFGANSLMVCIDVTSKGDVVAKGMRFSTNKSVEEILNLYKPEGLMRAQVTDVSRLGRESGCNVELYKRLVAMFPRISITASGGVGSIDEINELQAIGIDSVALCSAYFDGKISQQEILKTYDKKGE